MAKNKSSPPKSAEGTPFSSPPSFLVITTPMARTRRPLCHKDLRRGNRPYLPRTPAISGTGFFSNLRMLSPRSLIGFFNFREMNPFAGTSLNRESFPRKITCAGD